MEKEKLFGGIKSVDDIKREFSPAVNINEMHKSRMSKGDKIARFITKYVGTLGFFYICVILVVTPLLLPGALPVIQYISSGILQLLLLPLILISQNLQDRHEELIAQHDYETTVKAEREIESILMHLEKQDEVMLEILQRIEKLEKGVKN